MILTKAVAFECARHAIAECSPKETRKKIQNKIQGEGDKRRHGEDRTSCFSTSVTTFNDDI